MSAFWITLNFVLVLLALYLTVHLYQRIRLLQQKGSGQSAQEAQQLLAEHIEAVRLENEQFLAEVRGLLAKQAIEIEKASTSKRTEKMNAQVKATEKKTEPEAVSGNHSFADTLNDQKEQLHKAVKSKPPLSSVSGTEIPENEWMPPIDNVKDQVEESPFLHAMKLKEKGYSTTEIAKEMNRGKGEIELLLKLHGKV
ncbi:hypothetical protein [Sporolactobacillus nakayamae]|uniref:Swarming motility protein SwrB n=1 Tax=Sporolactobacillus nakayamae TaxID=269670 RepID=A0A1I2NC81_9BACL|nr:hypothetical protein [Sporolactobacillus nakayamae]SFG01193.1 hypothetical protein SAMN02982927_00400 [Sporolactobacillus nakayamae]